jgi:hypothetical protein
VDSGVDRIPEDRASLPMGAPAGLEPASFSARTLNLGTSVIRTVGTHILARHLPNTRVGIYADAGHGFLFRFPTEFAKLLRRRSASDTVPQAFPPDVADQLCSRGVVPTPSAEADLAQ